MMSALPRIPYEESYVSIQNLTEQSADLYIYGVIVDNSEFRWDESDVMPKDVLEALEQVKNLKELNIYINSPGGSVFAGQAIYNILNRSQAKKVVYIDGVAASIASVIALAGDEIKVPSNAFMMIHKPWVLAIGNSDNLRKTADDLDDIQKGIMNVYKENLAEGVEYETVENMVNKETWMSGEEIGEYFARVEVIQSKQVAACASEFLNNYHKAPSKLIKSTNKDKDPEPEVTESDDEKLKFQNELDLLEL